MGTTAVHVAFLLALAHHIRYGSHLDHPISISLHLQHYSAAMADRASQLWTDLPYVLGDCAEPQQFREQYTLLFRGLAAD